LLIVFGWWRFFLGIWQQFWRSQENVKTVHCDGGVPLTIKSEMVISSMTAFDGQLWTLTDTFNMASHMVGTSHDEEGLEDEKKLRHPLNKK
jgi:hypothetical protein